MQVVLSTLWKETNAYSVNGMHLAWQLLQKFCNCQIKITAKYFSYMLIQFNKPLLALSMVMICNSSATLL